MDAVWITVAVLMFSLLLFIWRVVLRVVQEAKNSLESADRAEVALGGLGLQIGRANRHLSRMSRTRLRQILLRRMIRIGGPTSGPGSKDIASEL